MSNPSENSAAPTGTSGYFGSCFSLEKIELQRRLEAAEARVKELELKLVRQDEVAREAYEAAVWKFGQERMELEAKNERLRLASELLLIGYEGLGGDMENNAPREVKAALKGENTENENLRQLLNLPAETQIKSVPIDHEIPGDPLKGGRLPFPPS